MPAPRLLLVCPENLSAREEQLMSGLEAAGSLAGVVLPSPEKAGAPPRNTPLIPLRRLGSMAGGTRPEAVVYASPPPPWLHRKVWRWKRRWNPAVLLGGYWGLPAPGRFARATMDFFLAGDEEAASAVRRAGVGARRILTAGPEGTRLEQIAVFIAGRTAAEGRCVLWVDEDISLHSPSTKHLVYSLPHLQADGWEIRAWCLTTDVPADAMETRRLPPPPRVLRTLAPFWFPAVVGVRALAQRVFTGRRRARIVHTVGGNDLGADLVAVQFINALWLRKQLELGVHGAKAWLQLFWTALGALKDRLQFRNRRCRTFLPASDSIGDELRRRCRPRAEIRTLPNSYDETRFNPEGRARWRDPIRAELGLGADDTVFVFSSQGHHQRKGFWLAVEGLERVRRRADVPRAAGARFLVIGGQPGTLDRLRARLTASHPGWERWVVFVGMQSAVERYLAAADAFLFPSYFEAFCLAEIEAGAMGLPLLLTPHHGTEMILRPGGNGLTLPFDPAGIETVLARFLSEGLPPFAPGAGRGLDRQGYARELAAIYRDFLERAGAGK